MPEGSPQSDDGRAARILQAADEVLGEVGYAGASVGEIARRAGVNKALVFYYYGSKAALFERVMEGYYGAHLEALQAAFDGGGTLEARLHRVVDAYLDFIAANLRYPRLIQQQVAGDGTHLPLIRRLLTPMYEWTARALAGLAPEEGPLAARHLFVTVSGMVINYFTYAPVLGALWGDDPLSEAQIAERRAHVHWMVDAVLAGLRRPA